MPDLSVLIVNWNVRDLLRRCLRSVLVNSPSCQLEIIVVDNGSTDGSVEMVRTEFPQVLLIANPDNRGFPAANNQGLAVARGRYVLLLNPDTEVVGNALETMIAFADAHPDVGVVGPQLLNPDGTIQSSRRRFPTLATAIFESTWLQPYAPRRLLTRYYVLDRPDGEIQDVDWVTGAALMARREAIEQVGPLDEGFFMYSEELDWCRRFRDAGWRVVYLPTAQVVHYGGKSSEQVLPARHIHFQASKIRYFRKYHGAPAARILQAVIVGNYLWQIGVEGAKWLLGHKRPMRAERISAYRRVVRALCTRAD
ncbi:MAG: glycosyltransferase family 2 protein [Anaerolineae bacterium]|nr:glycosyltransferase family 2 protein [Anaerolineae bacterium]MDW7991412.1 glycosyltransferase family 2 protein [Anaerolineae bacterium]